MSYHVVIIDVGPRDGLWNQADAKTGGMVLYASKGLAFENVGMRRLQAELNGEQVIHHSRADDIEVIATVSAACECPIDWPTETIIVCEAATKFLRLGASDIVIADTIGAANPAVDSGVMQQQ